MIILIVILYRECRDRRVCLCAPVINMPVGKHGINLTVLGTYHTVRTRSRNVETEIY